MREKGAEKLNERNQKIRVSGSEILKARSSRDKDIKAKGEGG